MTNFVVSNNQSARISMSGTDTLNVTAAGNLTVSSNAQAVRFNAPTTEASITNSGVIDATAAGGRAIRLETTVGAAPAVTISNNTSALIRGVDDAIQIQPGVVTGGKFTLFNSGVISSLNEQAVDLAGGTGEAVQIITNQLGAQILGSVSDAIRIGGKATINNAGFISGGDAAGYSQSSDGIQFEIGSSGTVTNNGTIMGDRHGINAGVNTTVSVTNNANNSIAGNNGSGVGLDGSGTIINRGFITGAFSDSAGSDINGSTPGLPNGGGPDGVKDGDGDGIDVDGLAIVENFGTIEGTGAGGTGSDGRPNTSEGIAAGGGTFTNHKGALIRGLGLGILIDDSSTGPAPFVTKVVNDGSITGNKSFAIKLIGLQTDEVDNAGVISGGGGVAMLLGGGNDTLKIRVGSSITGISDAEAGTADLLSYAAHTGLGVSVNLGTGIATGTGGVANFENVTGSQQADSLFGNASNNVLLGLGGLDTLSGGDGDDLLEGGAGNDSMDGGTGTDTASYAEKVAGVTVTLNGAAVVNVLVGGLVEDNVRNIENITSGSGADLLTGDALNNLFIAGGGADVLAMLGGLDTAYGEGGNDYLYMGEGNDVAVGGAGIDVLLLEGGDDTGYGGDDQDYLFGGDGNDVLLGDGGVDVLQGEAGADTLYGGADGDYFYGGADNDTGFGGDGNDILVMGAGNDSAFGEAGQDYFYMEDGDDTAHGGAGVDVFLGGAGNDVFEGGTDVDYAWGEGGNDAFVLRASSGVMVVQDFTAGGAEDQVRLAADTGITSFAQALAASTYFAGMNTTILTVDGDTSVWLVGVNSAQLTAADFAFV